jgi:short-subunit dehydrogenase
MGSWLRHVFAGRPWWMNALMVFSAYMAFVYVPWDLFAKPVAEDEEVWFGILFHGWAAKLGEPLHWAIYAAGAYGFHRMRPWMWPWAAVYTGQVAIGMFVWSAFYGAGGLAGVALGLVALAPFAILTRALWNARPLFQRPRASLRERYGEWALVTGASSGIGEQFARALARDGMSCVLVARREERLRALAAELEKQHGVSTRVISADLASPDGPDRLADAVDDLDVAVLLNNAGAGYAGRFDKQQTDRLGAMVQLNCVAPVVLTSRLLPGMLARGRGAIVVTGSIAGHQPLPLHAVYSATKAFDQFFGEALWQELRDRGIDVLVLEPGSTATEFHDVAGEVPHVGDHPVPVVEAALEALGRQPSVVYGWFNWLRSRAAHLAPRSVVLQGAHDVVAKHTPESMR